MEVDHRVLIVDGTAYTLPAQACFFKRGQQLGIKCSQGPFTVELQLEALESPTPADAAQHPTPADRVPDNLPSDADLNAAPSPTRTSPEADALEGAVQATAVAEQQEYLPGQSAASRGVGPAVSKPSAASEQTQTQAHPAAMASIDAHTVEDETDSVPDSLQEPPSPPSGDKENERANTLEPTRHLAEPAKPEHRASGSSAKQKARSAISKSAPPSKRMKPLSPLTPVQPLSSDGTARMQVQWKPVPFADEAAPHPTGRWGATLSALTDTQVILYGGANGTGPLGDAWSCNLDAPAWQDMGCQTDRSSKSWHSAEHVTTAGGHYLVAYGGEFSVRQQASFGNQIAGQVEDDEDAVIVSDVCMLDISDLQDSLWVDVPIQGEKGRPPPERAGHTCTMLPDGRMLMFGGMDNRQKHYNDLFILDPKALMWYKLTGAMKGAPPKGRAYHSAVLVGGKVIVVGGTGKHNWSMKEVYSLTVAEGSCAWKEHTNEVDGDIPSPRNGHTAVALPDQRHMLIFGGGNIDSGAYHGNIAVLDTQTWRWSIPNIQGAAKPSARLGHTMVLLQPEGRPPTLFMHGGRTWDDDLCTDSWLLELLS